MRNVKNNFLLKINEVEQEYNFQLTAIILKNCQCG